MSLSIQTFSNVAGGETLFKALGHPLAAEAAPALLARLADGPPVAVCDPHGHAETFAAFYDLSRMPIQGVYVQDVTRIGEPVLGQAARALSALRAAGPARVLLVSFDGAQLAERLAPVLPEGVEVLSLDALRLPARMLTNARRYLDPRNFATNFALLREADGWHSRLVTANYWAGYGASGHRLWCRLFDQSGAVLATWEETLPDRVSGVVLDSKELRARFGLPEFTGSLFVHAQGIAGHDVVKYALDLYGDSTERLSCTHDANAWPADRYAGLPAPAPGERVILWVQNSHPCPIPPGAVGLSLMGADEVRPHPRGIAPFATAALDVADLFPEASWPAQFEIHAGRHFVRPRYEVHSAAGRVRIAHANVERSDLVPDPGIARHADVLGKGYLLPAPVLPVARFATSVLPTPMATTQRHLPIAIRVYDHLGREVASRSLGNLARDHRAALEVDELLAASRAELAGGYGHLELGYDLAAGSDADGWLHALFRYHDRASGHLAETSFGAHMFNSAMVYGNEPQSYQGPPPGLSTRLFLRLGPPPTDTLCQLIYPASMPWREHSSTMLVLHDAAGGEVARRTLEIPCGGSRLWRYQETFEEAERARAGAGAYVLVRDTGCRLFGYHGLLCGGGAFSFDHMFGF